MEKINNKYEYFDQFLAEYFEIDNLKQYAKDFGTIAETKVDIEEIAKELYDKWELLTSNSIFFPDIQKKYVKELRPWKRKYAAFEEIEDENDLIRFIETHFSTWMRINVQNEDISQGEIRNILLHEKPKFMDFMEISRNRYLTLLVYQSNGFRLFLHLRLERDKLDVYSVRSIYSFWFKDYYCNWNANLEDINSQYRNSILGFEIVKQLKALNYEQDFLNTKTSKDSLNIALTNQNKEEINYPSNSLTKEIISENPIKLFHEIEEELNNIEMNIEEINKQENLNPQNYFKRVSQEVKDFLKKGKELFLKTEHFLEKPERKGKKSKGEKQLPSKSKVSFNQIVSFFKKEKQIDKKNDSIKIEDKGFRTKNQIFNEYQIQIDASKPTFYDYFDDLALTNFLEVREKKGKGGGFEYRYPEIDAKLMQIKEEKKRGFKETTKNKFAKTKVNIRKALSFYDNSSYDKALEIFKNLLKDPKNQLEKNPRLLTITLYYVAKCYFKQKNFSKANEFFIKANLKGPELIQPIYYTIETFFHLKKYKEGLEYAEKLIEKILKMIAENDLQEILDFIYLKGKYIEFEEEPPSKLLNKKLIGDKNLILINKDPESYRLGYIYRRSFNLSERQIELLKNNYLSIQILYKKLLFALYLKFEILRKIYFYSIIKNDFENALDSYKKFEKQVNDLRDYYYLGKIIKTRDLRNYFYYFDKIAHIFNFPDIYRSISKEFLKIAKDMSHPSHHYLRENFRGFFEFLNTLNRRILIPDFNKKYKILWLDLDPSVIKSPQLYAEFYFLQAYMNDKYSIEQRIKIEKEKLKKFHLEDIKDINNILTSPDDFYNQYRPIQHPDKYIEIAKRAYDFIYKNNFDELFDLIFNIYQHTKRKVREINELRYKRRRKVIQRKLGLLQKQYEPKYQEFSINVEKENIVNFRSFVEKNIIDKIKHVIKTNTGGFGFAIKLFDPDLNKEVIQYIEKRSFIRNLSKEFKPVFKLVPFSHIGKENENIIITLHDTWDLQDPIGTLGEVKDVLNLKIYQAIGLNLKQFRIIISDDEKTELKDYFTYTFPNEYENNFFKFELIENWDKNEVIIEIKSIK